MPRVVRTATAAKRVAEHVFHLKIVATLGLQNAPCAHDSQTLITERKSDLGERLL